MSNEDFTKDDYFLIVPRRFAAYLDHSNADQETLPELIAVLLYIYTQCFKWDGVDYGYCKTTMREIAAGIGYIGNTQQTQKIRAVLSKLVKLKCITDQSPKPMIEQQTQWPSDLLVIRLNKKHFNAIKTHFVKASTGDLAKLFAAKPKLKRPRNSLMNLLNLWFFLSCAVWDGNPASYGYRSLRKKLGRTDETIDECFDVLHEFGFFSRIKLHSTKEDGKPYWMYFKGKRTIDEMRSVLNRIEELKQMEGWYLS